MDGHRPSGSVEALGAYSSGTAAPFLKGMDTMVTVTVLKARKGAKPKTFRQSPAPGSSRKPDYAMIPRTVGSAQSQYATPVQAQEQFASLSSRIRRNRMRLEKARRNGHWDKVAFYRALLEDQMAKLDMLMPGVEAYYNG